MIISGGELEYTKLPDEIKIGDYYVIAADKGYEYALRLGISPDAVVGDFDTLGKVPECGETQVYPKEKDDTDTMLAARLCVKKGFKEAVIIGALGGRLDHTVANIQTLKFLLDSGVKAEIISPDEKITLLKDSEIILSRTEGFSLSVFALDSECRGVTERGVKYPAEKAVINSGFPIGACNEITDKCACISVEKGTLLIIQSKIQGRN